MYNSMPLPTTTWTSGELGTTTASRLVDEFGDFLIDQNGNFLVTGTSLVTPNPATDWASVETTPDTTWTPELPGEMSTGTSYFLVDESGDFLVTQADDLLITGTSIFTPLDDTIWGTGVVPTGVIQDESDGYILDEMGGYIEDEASMPGEGFVPDTTWTPPDQSEMSTTVNYFLIDQAGNFLVDENGDFLITGDSLSTPFPKTTWMINDGL